MTLTRDLLTDADEGTFEWDWPFVLVSFAVVLVARAVNTFPLCMIANMFQPAERRIPFKYMIVIWFAGLRGAIAFALALNIRTNRPTSHTAIIRASSLFTVLASTIVRHPNRGAFVPSCTISNVSLCRSLEWRPDPCCACWGSVTKDEERMNATVMAMAKSE